MGRIPTNFRGKYPVYHHDVLEIAQCNLRLSVSEPEFEFKNPIEGIRYNIGFGTFVGTNPACQTVCLETVRFKGRFCGTLSDIKMTLYRVSKPVFLSSASQN